LLRRLADAAALAIGARLQAELVEAHEIERKLPELRTKVVNLTTNVDRLGREIEQLELELRKLDDAVASRVALFDKASAERDEQVRAHALAEQRLKNACQAIAELENIEKEDPAHLAEQIDDARRRSFRVSQQVEENQGRLRVLKERISKLENGIPVFPDSVDAMLNSLGQAGIRCCLAATCIEIEDPRWTLSVESALGPLRYALCVAPDDLDRTIPIAHRHGFPGPLVTASASQSLESGPIRVSAGAPAWLSEWLRQVRFSEIDEWRNAGGRVLYMSGLRQDEYGTWVSGVTTYVIGGNAIRKELEQARRESAEIELNLTADTESQRNSTEEVALIEARIENRGAGLHLKRMLRNFK
jgi:predicted  nucleic acid-binding Zn-ribbon protein